ncbi:MAG: hypothetical protein BWY88_01198 [Synergistetes bacterium ADurb.Bin520]|nr:MAG: hypothetical protein BWY88_01198 [Synergistetes bacterium ADurb.Bin520]
MRILCSLSASLIRMTRISLIMAKSIFRMVSASWMDLFFARRIDIFVTPFTRDSTSRPKRPRSSWRLASVSSRTSWSRAAMTDW